MPENDIDAETITEAIDAAEKRKEALKTDPDAVRKILGNQVTVTDIVTVYPNKKLNKQYEDFKPKIVALGEKLKRKEGESDEDYSGRIDEFKKDYESAVAEFDALKAAISQSAVTFELESLSRKAIKNIRTTARKKFPLPTDGTPDDPEVAEARDEWYKSAIIAAHLVKDDYTVEDIEIIRDEWPTRCWVQLWQSANKLSIADDYLGSSFTSDF